MDTKKLKSGIAAGLIEVTITHPIDYYKTISQHNFYKNKTIIKNNFKSIFSGFSPRLFGIIPMRVTFWCGQDYGESIFKNFDYKYLYAGAFAGLLQTPIDYPMELLKIKRITKGNDNLLKINHFRGFISTLSRNVLFAAFFNYNVKTRLEEDNTIYQNFAISATFGCLASIITQPLDYLKTISQTHHKENIKNIILKSYQKNNNFLFLFKGGFFRSSISFVGMGIGFCSYNYFNKL